MLKKEDIILRFAKRGYTKAAAKCVVNDFVQVLTEILAEGNSVMLHGFGTFEVREIKGHLIMDYQSQKHVQLNAVKVPKFMPGKRLKRAVREGRIID